MKLSKFQKIILGLILVTLILVGLIYFTQDNQEYLEVTTLDIGQGDAILIETPYDQNILIDGGPDNSVIYGLSRNLPFFERTIDLMILTHPDADHVTGLVEVLRRYEVKKVLYTGVVHNSSNYRAFLSEIEAEGAEVGIVGEAYDLSLGEDLVLKILYPDFSANGLEFDDVNDTSIVAELSYGEIDFMLTGDASIEVEEKLIDKEIDLEAEVLKAGHHGSKTSTSLEFVEVVSPQYGIISAGADNSFGHPNLRVIKNLEKRDVEILETAEMGDIVFVSDGEELWLE